MLQIAQPFLNLISHNYVYDLCLFKPEGYFYIRSDFPLDGLVLCFFLNAYNDESEYQHYDADNNNHSF